MEKFEFPVMADSLMSAIATFHTTIIIVADFTKFPFISSISESMYRCVSKASKLINEYKKLLATGLRPLTPEMQQSLNITDKPAKLGKERRYEEGNSRRGLF